MTDTYKIVRFRFNDCPKKLPGMGGLTLEAAQAHCSRPDTNAKGRCEACGYVAKRHEETSCQRCGQLLHREWFDGYQRER